MSGSCIETAEAPAWLSKLESQREKLSKGKLGHDSGAGAACNSCGSKCPGLDLHFWRKVCRACHCHKDVHDVQDDDMSGWAQFELLGTARPKKSNHTIMKIQGISDEPVKLDWVPPNTSPDMVSDYMTSLGGSLAPVAGSGGAARRREQLRRQIPPHDISSDLCCHKLTQQEEKDHQEYISRIKNQVVGMGNIVRIGTIQKGNTLSINTEGSQPVPGTKSYSLPLRVSNLGKGIKFINVPKNTTDKHLVLDNMGNVVTKSAHISDYKTSPIISRVVRDKLNFMRIESDRIKSAVEHGPIYDRLFKDLKQLNVPVDSDVYLNPIKHFRAEYNTNPKFKDETTAFVEAQGAKIVTPCSLNNNDNSLRSRMMPNNYSQNGTIFGPTGEIWSWSTHTEDPNNSIDPLYAKNSNPNYLASSDNINVHKQNSGPLNSSGHGDDTSDIPPIPNYDTYPGQLNRGPPSNTDNVPIYENVHNIGEHSDQLALLKTNRGVSYPGHRKLGYPPMQRSEDSVIPDQMIELVADLRVNPNDNSEGEKSLPCQRCHLAIEQGEVAVNAERAGKNASWHPQCFTCHKCNQLLADLVYFYYQGEIYCARDLAEALKIPRCSACDELIFSRSYTAAEGQFFHVNHFCCYHCDEPLGGKKYIPDNKSGQPMCLDCDYKFHAVKCNKCKTIIGPEQQGVSWSSFHWHGTCFNCSSYQCGKSLLSGKFVMKGELPFCSASCLSNKKV